VATGPVLMAVFVPVAFYPGGIAIIYKQLRPHDRLLDATSAFNALTFSPCSSGLILRGCNPSLRRARSWIGARVDSSALPLVAFNGVGGGLTFLAWWLG